MSGAAQGVQAGTQAIQARELQRQAAIKAQRDQDWQNQFANGQTPSWAGGLPASLVHAAMLAGPDQGTTLLGQGIIHKGDLDANLKQAAAMANLEFGNQMRLLKAQQDLKLQNFGRFMGDTPAAGGGPAPATAPTMPMSPAPPMATPGPAQGSATPQAPQQSWLDQIPAPMNPRTVFAGVSSGLIPADAGKFALEGDQQKLGTRAQIAKQAGMDPNDPVTREYVMTGSYPKQEKNWPAIREADQNVVDLQNSVDLADQAAAHNQKAFAPGWISPSTKAYWSGVTGIDKEAGDATQNYMSEVKLLSGQLAKAVGGTRPTAYETKVINDSQASPDKQTPEVRADIIKRMKTALQTRLSLAQRQADELRNGTYYAPRSAGGAASAPQALPDPLGIR